MLSRSSNCGSSTELAHNWEDSLEVWLASVVERLSETIWVEGMGMERDGRARSLKEDEAASEVGVE
jgi:hypothetical protein